LRCWRRSITSHWWGEIEKRRRLIEQQNRRALGERHRDPGPLALPTGQLVDRPGRQIGQVGLGERPRDGGLVGGRPLPEPPLVWMATAAHQIPDRQPVRCDRLLEKDPELGRHLARRRSVDRLSVEQHHTAFGLHQPGEPAQECRLAARVRADDDRDLTGRDLQREAVDDHPIVLRQRQRVSDETARHRRSLVRGP
jgi:hypothetical protein